MSLAVNIQNLVKVYSSGFHALKGIDLQVDEGDFFALIGPNGAGKSTTIGILSSLVNKTSGDVVVFEHNIDKEPNIFKKQLGVVSQEFNFGQFETPFDILVTSAGYFGIRYKQAAERAEELLIALSIWDKKDTASRMLSGGMKRRLMIARALMHKPRMLILDEPTAGMDIETRHSMWNFMVDLNKKGTTIVLTTHYLEEAEQLCRNIAIINQGVIIENTSMQSLLSSLDIQSFILNLNHNNAVDVAPQITGYNIKYLDAHTLEVAVPNNIGITKLFTQLANMNIEVMSMSNKSNRLEELFVSILNDDKKKIQKTLQTSS